MVSVDGAITFDNLFIATIEEAALQSALAMSVDPSGGGPAAGNLGNIDFNALTEEQQIALALQMSLAEAEEPMETETPAAEPKQVNFASRPPHRLANLLKVSSIWQLISPLIMFLPE